MSSKPARQAAGRGRQDTGPGRQDTRPARQDTGPARQDTGPARQDTGPAGQGRGGTTTAVTVAAYTALFLLGLLEGLIGSFQYSQGPVPLLAIVFAVAIFVTCALGARGMRSALGGVLPAVGWFLVTLWLSNGTASGSVVITDSTAGKWFLFGGALAAAAGAVVAFVRWSRASRERRDAPGRPPR